MANKAEGIRVLVRVRPPIEKEALEDTAVHSSGQSITVRSDKSVLTCAYDSVFNEVCSNADVFDYVRPILESVIEGFNVCAFVYGQTSSGKTHTMLGPSGGQRLSTQAARSDWGILPLTVEHIFGLLSSRADQGELTYKIKCSFLQIYNETLMDLLRDDTSLYEEDAEALKIREIPRLSPTSSSADVEVYVSGLSEFRVQTANDVFSLLRRGTARRITSSTDFNLTSSRSHAVLQLFFEIDCSDDSGGDSTIRRSKLSLVDLAGSEKMSTVAEDSAISPADMFRHVRELTSINKSLSSLGNVISALSSPARTHVPYRDSKLTRLLQDSLGGNTRTVIIACVAPSSSHAAESISTLQFADRAKSVMVKVRANVIVDEKYLLARANKEIERLRLLLKHSLAGKDITGLLASGGGGAVENAALVLKLTEENTLLRLELQALKASQGEANAANGGVSSVRSAGGDSDVASAKLLHQQIRSGAAHRRVSKLSKRLEGYINLGLTSIAAKDDIESAENSGSNKGGAAAIGASAPVQSVSSKVKPQAAVDEANEATKLDFPLIAVAAPPAATGENPLDLSFGGGDVGKQFEMYSFRYNSWRRLLVKEFDASTLMHRCEEVDGGGEAGGGVWINLKSKKPVRCIVGQNNIVA